MSNRDLAINTLARQLLADLAEQTHAEAIDGYDHTGVLDGLPEGIVQRIVKEARDLTANLAPSGAALEAARRMLALSAVAIPTPVPQQSDTEDTTSPPLAGS